MLRVLLTDSRFDPDEALARFAADRTENAGAMASFVGFCRASNDGAAVQRLDLDHYPGFTGPEIERLARALAERRELSGLLVIHRCGRVLPGEPIVLVVALAAHRSQAFAAVEELMDYLKTDAPFWKRETSAEGARWIEPTGEDRRRRDRWRHD